MGWGRVAVKYGQLQRLGTWVVVASKNERRQHCRAASKLGVVRGCVARGGPQRRQVQRHCQLRELHSVRGPALDLHRSAAAGGTSGQQGGGWMGRGAGMRNTPVMHARPLPESSGRRARPWYGLQCQASMGSETTSVAPPPPHPAPDGQHLPHPRRQLGQQHSRKLARAAGAIRQHCEQRVRRMCGEWHGRKAVEGRPGVETPNLSTDACGTCPALVSQLLIRAAARGSQPITTSQKQNQRLSPAHLPPPPG